MKPKSSSLCSH